jgi:hypothetical protein
MVDNDSVRDSDQGKDNQRKMITEQEVRKARMKGKREMKTMKGGSKRQ